MNLSKIKYDAGKDAVELEWTEIKDTGTKIDHALHCSETPAPEFITALAAFEPLVLALLELPGKYGEGFRVQSPSINEEKKDGRLGLVVTCFKTLEATNFPLLLNTPHLREPMEGSDEGAGFFSKKMRVALDDAQKAAWAFISGKRAQGNLFAEAAKS